MTTYHYHNRRALERAVQFFQFPQEITHKKYEALRAFYLEGKSAAEVAQQFGYTVSAVYSLTRDFNQHAIATKSFSTIFRDHYSGSEA